jgi:hypothetical protein
MCQVDSSALGGNPTVDIFEKFYKNRGFLDQVNVNFSRQTMCYGADK